MGFIPRCFQIKVGPTQEYISELAVVKRLLRKLFPALFPTSEYVTGSAEGLPCMLKCVAVVDGKRIEFEKQPMFLGYKPLVMGVCVPYEQTELFRSARSIGLNYENIKSNQKVARIDLKYDQQVELDDTTLLLFIGISSSQNFERTVERWAFKVNQWLSTKSANNIDLSSTEYDQLKIAYSVPREIRMVTVRHELGANSFPIDLFGSAGMKHLILSLRHEKKSCSQILEAKQITMRHMFGTYAPIAYFTGRCHSMNWHKAVLPPDQIGKEEFEFKQIIGDYGVHRVILLSRISPTVAESPEKLVHVHRSYANWHIRQGFPLKEIPH